jgi:hypothetical protein
MLLSSPAAAPLLMHCVAGPLCSPELILIASVFWVFCDDVFGESPDMQATCHEITSWTHDMTWTWGPKAGPAHEPEPPLWQAGSF